MEQPKLQQGEILYMSVVWKISVLKHWHLKNVDFQKYYIFFTITKDFFLSNNDAQLYLLKIIIAWHLVIRINVKMGVSQTLSFTICATIMTVRKEVKWKLNIANSLYSDQVRDEV